MQLRQIAFVGVIATCIAGLAVDIFLRRDEDRFDARVHDYLAAHPEVLLEMSQSLQQRQAAAQQAALQSAKTAIDANHAAIFDDGRDGVVGNAAGDVTVAIFEDKECPYCKAVVPDLAKLAAADPGVRIVYKEFPILGPGSVTAARAVLAAIAQGKFEAFNAALFADKTPEHQLSEAHIFEIAQANGLDVTRLKADMTAPAIDAVIAANQELARKIGINGTPGIIVGDTLMPGAVPYQTLVQAVADERRRVTAARQTNEPRQIN